MANLYYPFDPSRISEGYGYAEWRGGIHDGIDFAIAQGTDLRATASGVVRNNDAGTRDGAGIDITTPDGWIVRHWHVSSFGVANGSTVEAGQVIGKTGGTPGTWGAGNTTGAHLHWGVKVGATWVDPEGLNPTSFDNLRPKPISRKKTKMGAFYRTPDGGILWQEKPNTAFYPLNFTTWKAYAAQGNTYADLSKEEVDALVAKYGIVNK